MNRESAVAVAFESGAARDHLNAVLALPDAVPPLPALCAQIAELTAQECIDAERVAELLQSDPLLAGQVMWAASSPIRSPRAAIVSLPQALSWLGATELRNVALSVALRDQVFTAPGRQAEADALWREVALAGQWAREIARARGEPLEEAYLAALMHRGGAALAIRILARFEREQGTVLDARDVGRLAAEFEARCARSLLAAWCLPAQVRDAVADWRTYRDSSNGDLAATVHAAHLLATHTLQAPLSNESLIAEHAVFARLRLPVSARRLLLLKREQLRALAGA